MGWIKVHILSFLVIILSVALLDDTVQYIHACTFLCAATRTEGKAKHLCWDME